MSLAALALAALTGVTGASGAAAVGSVCLPSVADPTPGEKSLYNYTADIPTPDYSAQFNDGSRVQLRHSPRGSGAGVLVTGLALEQPWTVRIRLAGKQIESFRFRFEAMETSHLCLVLKEFYMTWNLWNADQWPKGPCRCGNATSVPWKQ